MVDLLGVMACFSRLMYEGGSFASFLGYVVALLPQTPFFYCDFFTPS